MKNFQIIKVHPKMSLDGGEGSAEQAAVLRYSPEKVKHHILAAMKKNNGMFRGVEALKRAAEEGHPSLLRKGQIIFGTVSIASYKKAKGSFRGWIYNTLAPVLTLATVGQKRTFAYLHVAVYVGAHNGEHYVVNNCGANPATGTGQITLNPLGKSFEEDGAFFVVSPPKDQRNRSTRYLVLQRALASLGLEYTYHIRAVSCETFVTALFGLLSDDLFDPLQTEVLQSPLPEDIKEQKARDFRRFKKFHQDLCTQIESVPEGTILTLRFFMERPDKQAYPWFQQMAVAYARYIEAARR